jgi:hypothetical protein
MNLGSDSPVFQRNHDESTRNIPGPLSYGASVITHYQLELGKCNLCLKKMATYVCLDAKCRKAICPDCADSKKIGRKCFCVLCCVKEKRCSTAASVRSFIIRKTDVSRYATMIEHMTFMKWQAQYQRYLVKADQDDEEFPPLEFEKEVVEETLLPCHQKFIVCLQQENHQWHKIHQDAKIYLHEYVRLCRSKALLERWRKTQEKEWSYIRYQTYEQSASTFNCKHLRMVEFEKDFRANTYYIALKTANGDILNFAPWFFFIHWRANMRADNQEDLDQQQGSDYVEALIQNAELNPNRWILVDPGGLVTTFYLNYRVLTPCRELENTVVCSSL